MAYVKVATKLTLRRGSSIFCVLKANKYVFNLEEINSSWQAACRALPKGEDFVISPMSVNLRLIGESEG